MRLRAKSVAVYQQAHRILGAFFLKKYLELEQNRRDAAPGERSVAACRVGYILKGYPRISEVFISNEIYLLEQLGLNLRVFSVKPSEDTSRHASIKRIKAPVDYLPQVTSLSNSSFLLWLWQNLPAFKASHLALMKLRTRAYLKTLLGAVKMCLVYRSSPFAFPKKAFIKEFLQAGIIALEALRDGSVRHFHAHFCHGATTIALFASQMAGLPFSFTAHAKDIYLKKLNPRDLLRIKLKKAKFVCTCTAANKAYLEAICPDGAPVHLIYHGLNTELFRPVLGERQGLQILAIGRFVAKKGFTFLIEACRILKDRGYEFNCRVVGEAGEQSSTVQRLIKELNLEDTISLQGAVIQEELQEIYQSATIFALPCQIVENGDRDGIPNVLAEAMANELPVVSTNISGIPELVTNGIDGLLVPQKNAAALADAIERLLQDQPLRQRLGQAARAKICRIFDSKKNTVALRDLFVT